MPFTMNEQPSKADRLLVSLQRLLELPATDVTETIQQTAQVLTHALRADKADVFLDEPYNATLIAVGTSFTPLGKKQRAIGLDRLPLKWGGRVAEVYHSGHSHMSGRVRDDPEELRGFKEDLQVQSEILVPLSIEDQRRGVLLVASHQPDFFTEQDLQFLDAVSRWIGVVLYRAELSEQQARERTEQDRRLAAEEILTVMAHDLRNYLTPLKGRVDLLTRRASRNKQDSSLHDLKEIQRLIRRLSDLMDDLLDAERLKQGLFSLHRQTVDLVQLVKEIALVWTLPTHPIEIEAPAQLILILDQDRITQALENLLSNAITHANLDSPIHIRLAQEQRIDGLWAIITVSNQGPALAPEQLASLFQPFTKGRHSQGLGLGLWLAQRIAQAHQGMLTVQMEAEHTIALTLELPFDVTPVGQELQGAGQKS